MTGKIKHFLWEWRATWITAPCVTGIVILLRYFGLFQSLEWSAFDQYMRWRPPQPHDQRIVIVGIDEADAKYLHQGYIADGVFAQLLEKLKKRQPRAIGLDIYRDLPFEPGHKQLVKVFTSTPNLVGIQKVVGNSSLEAVAPPPALKAKDQVGANDVIVDADNKVRRGLIYLQDRDGKTIYSFSIYLALLYLEKAGIAPENVQGKEIWKLGKTIFTPFQPSDGGYIRAEAGGYQVILNYHGPKNYFDIVPLRDVLEDKLPQNWGRDRIILIGRVGASYDDLFYTPYSGGLINIPERMSGIEIQANLISQILTSSLSHDTLIHSWSEPEKYLWIFAWAGFGAIVTWKWRYTGVAFKPQKSFILKTQIWIPQIFLNNLPFWWRAIALTTGAGILFSSTYIAFIYGWWLPIVTPVLALTGSVFSITAYTAHTADSIRKIFGRYLTNEVVATLLESPEGLKLGGKRQTLTIVTSDLRGFTALSEELSPEIVVQILNIYLEPMLDVIHTYQGNVDKFMGDGILILFGAPTTRKDDAPRAVACAIAMQLAMNDINKKLTDLNLPTLEMGIGINTGEVVVGNIGSVQHTEYTVIGSQMNLTFRIESYATGNQILISEPTLKAAGRSNLTINGEMEVKPKGIQDMITIYDVGGIGEPFNLFLSQAAEIFYDLREPIPIIYQLLAEKQVSAGVLQGNIIRLSEKGAQVKLTSENANFVPSPLSNIKLNLLFTDSQDMISRDIYAKVSGKKADAGSFYISFTFTPTVEAGLLSQTLSQSLNTCKSSQLN